MKPAVLFTACALALLPLSTASAGPQAPTTFTPLGQNAALQYWQAFNFLPPDQADLEKLSEWRTLPLDDRSEGLIGNLRFLHAGAQIKQADWGVDLSQGPYTLLPFLNRSRPLTHQACLRVRFDISRMKYADAVEHGCDALVAARHVTNPPVMIAYLVCFADERDTTDALCTGLNSFDPESLARLTTRLDNLPPMPTLSDSLNLERSMTVEWAIKKVRSAGPNPNWRDTLGFLGIREGQPDMNAVDQYVKRAGGTPDAVAAKLEALLPFYKEAQTLDAANLSQSEFNKQAQTLLSRYASNPFASPILPNLTAVHDNIIAAQTRLTLLRAAIAVTQHGPDAAKQFTDPSDHHPFTYQPHTQGFTLTSTIIFRNQPLSLTIGAK
jgi:hypothetical protein